MNRKYNFALILEDKFPISSFTLATDCLRLANELRQTETFNFKVYTDNESKVKASNNVMFGSDGSFEKINDPDYIFIFSTNGRIKNYTKKLSSILREKHHEGIPILAIDNGAFILAEAGLINKINVTLHWEAKEIFKEKFPDIAVLNDLCTVNDNKINFCAGGIAMLDFMINIITDMTDNALARQVSNIYVHTPRKFNQPQRVDQNFNQLSQKFICKKAIALMETNIEFPIKILELASRLNVSVRTLEREFTYSHSISPIKFYLRLRLHHAKKYLYYENYKINAISNMCGFNYNSVFNNAFKKEFKKTPKECRNYYRKEQNAAIRPELKDIRDY